MAIQLRRRAGWCPSRTTLALSGFLAVAAALLLAGHTDHVIAALPFLLILACSPLVSRRAGRRVRQKKEVRRCTGR